MELENLGRTLYLYTFFKRYTLIFFNFVISHLNCIPAMKKKLFNQFQKLESSYAYVFLISKVVLIIGSVLVSFFFIFFR